MEHRTRQCDRRRQWWPLDGRDVSHRHNQKQKMGTAPLLGTLVSLTDGRKRYSSKSSSLSPAIADNARELPRYKYNTKNQEAMPRSHARNPFILGASLTLQTSLSRHSQSIQILLYITASTAISLPESQTFRFSGFQLSLYCAEKGEAQSLSQPVRDDNSMILQ